MSADDQSTSVTAAIKKGVVDAFAPLGRFLNSLGDHLLLAGRALACLPRRPFRANNYLEAAEYIGFGSLPIILLVGAFTGMVVALQAVFTLRILQAESFAGAFTSKGLALELAPVLTALMLAGRAGSGIATEIGTMRISEQIDALESMAVNPIQFLVLPRIVVGTLVGPILTLLFFVVGMAGAYFISVVVQSVPAGPFTNNIRDILHPIDVIQGLIKAAFFGFMVTLIGCYQGYHASGGGRGVGIGTTRAVVIASVVVLVSDYFLTDVLLSISAVPQ